MESLIIEEAANGWILRPVASHPGASTTLKDVYVFETVSELTRHLSAQLKWVVDEKVGPMPGVVPEDPPLDDDVEEIDPEQLRNQTFIVNGEHYHYSSLIETGWKDEQIARLRVAP